MRREVRTIAQVEIDRQRADFEDAVHRLENNNHRLSSELKLKSEVGVSLCVCVCVFM